MGFSRTGDFDFTDNGDGTATITDNGALIDFTDFAVGSWVELQNFDQDDMNTFAVVLSTSTTTDLDLALPDAGTDTSNTDAIVIQLPTFAIFTAAEIAAAGYDTSEPLDVIVYQMSGVVGRGQAGFDSLGVDR